MLRTKNFQGKSDVMKLTPEDTDQNDQTAAHTAAVPRVTQNPCFKEFLSRLSWFALDWIGAWTMITSSLTCNRMLMVYMRMVITKTLKSQSLRTNPIFSTCSTTSQGVCLTGCCLAPTA